MQHKATPTADTAVLNSVVNLPRALPFLARHTTIHAFLDNDEAGRLTLERLRSACPVRPSSTGRRVTEPTRI